MLGPQNVQKHLRLFGGNPFLMKYRAICVVAHAILPCGPGHFVVGIFPVLPIHFPAAKVNCFPPPCPPIANTVNLCAQHGGWSSRRQ